MNDYQQLATSFGKVRSSWKRTAALSGFAIVVTESIGILTILLFLDWLYHPHPAIRLAMWSLALVGIAWFFFKHVFEPLARNIPDDQIAMYIEEHRDDLDGVLITAAEYGRKRDKIAGNQAALIDAVIHQASTRASATAGQVVDWSRLKKYGIAAAAGIGLYILLATLFPNVVGHHIGRILTPWHPTSEDLPKHAPGAVLIEPIKFTLSKEDTSLARGTSFDFEATLSRPAAGKPVVLNFRPVAQGANAPWQSLPMTEIEKINGFQGALADVSEDLEYNVSCGGDKSETHRLTVFDPLVIQSIEVTTHYPAYAKLPDRVEKPSSGDIEALIGSTVTVRINASTPLKSGQVKWAGGQTQPITADAQANTSGTFSFEVKEDGSYQYALADTNGQQAASTEALTVKAIADQPPTIEVKSPQGTVLSNPLGEVNFEVDASDDFGVDGMDLVYSRFDASGMPQETRVPLKLVAGDTKAGPNAKHATYKFMLEDAKPAFKYEDAIPFHLEARDAKGQKALSEIGMIVVGYFETWGTWELPHGPEDEKSDDEGPDIQALLSMTWLLDGQKSKLMPADYQQQAQKIAEQMMKGGSLRDFVDLVHTPQLAKVKNLINAHAGKAHTALAANDTATAVVELSTAVAIMVGNGVIENTALAKNAANSSSSSGSSQSKPPALTMLEQARLDALSQGSKESKSEDDKADAKTNSAAAKDLEDLIKKQDDIIAKAKGQAQQPDPSAKGTEGAKGKQDEMAKNQNELADKTKGAAEKAKAAANGKGAGSGTKLQNAADKTAEAAKKMGEAAKDFAAGKNAEGAAKAEEAKKTLAAAHDTLQNTNRDKLETAISQAAARAAALLEKQATLRKDTESTAKELDGGKAPDQRQKRDLEKQAYQETLLRADGELLKKDIDSLNTQATEVGQAEAIRSLTEAQKVMKRSQPEAKMGNAVIDLNNATPAPAAEEQKKAEDGLQKIVDDLHAGSDALAASKDALLRRAQRAAAEAKKGLDELAGKKEGEKAGEQGKSDKGVQAKNGNQPDEKGKTGNQPGEQAKNGNQPDEKGKTGNQPGEQAKNGNQPDEKGKTGNQPGEQAKNGNQPDEKGKTGNQPGEQAKNGNQPDEKGKTGNQPGEQAKNGNQPDEKGKAGNQPGEQAKNGNQPDEKGKAGNQPGEQAKNGDQSNQPGKIGAQAQASGHSESGGGKQEKIQKLAYDIQRLATNLDNRNIVSQKDVDELKDLSKDKAELEKRLAVDPKLLSDVSGIVSRISDSLEAESEAKTEASKLFSSQREECPPAYRQFVNQYFEVLSQAGHAPQPKSQP